MEVLKNAFKGFSDDKVPMLSGSLAYATIFSMTPLLLIIISLGSIFLGRDAVEGKVYNELNGIFIFYLYVVKKNLCPG